MVAVGTFPRADDAAFRAADEIGGPRVRLAVVAEAQGAAAHAVLLVRFPLLVLVLQIASDAVRANQCAVQAELASLARCRRR